MCCQSPALSCNRRKRCQAGIKISLGECLFQVSLWERNIRAAHLMSFGLLLGASTMARARDREEFDLRKQCTNQSNALGQGYAWVTPLRTPRGKLSIGMFAWEALAVSWYGFSFMARPRTDEAAQEKQGDTKRSEEAVRGCWVWSNGCSVSPSGWCGWCGWGLCLGMWLWKLVVSSKLELNLSFKPSPQLMGLGQG